MDRGQSFVEYVLLVAVALVGLLITVSTFMQGPVKDGFSHHFDTVKTRIVGH